MRPSRDPPPFELLLFDLLLSDLLRYDMTRASSSKWKALPVIAGRRRGAVALQRIPSELYEAASIDGVGPVRRFFSVSLPLVREMTGLMMIVTVSGAFQVFNEVMVMTTGGPNNSSQVLGTWLYRSGFVRNDFGYAAAIATAIFFITLSLALLQLWISRKRRVEW